MVPRSIPTFMPRSPPSRRRGPYHAAQSDPFRDRLSLGEQYALGDRARHSGENRRWTPGYGRIRGRARDEDRPEAQVTYGSGATGGAHHYRIPATRGRPSTSIRARRASSSSAATVAGGMKKVSRGRASPPFDRHLGLQLPIRFGEEASRGEGTVSISVRVPTPARAHQEGSAPGTFSAIRRERDQGIVGAATTTCE